MRKGKKIRHKSLATAEALTLHQLYRDLHRPKILKMEMESRTLEITAHVDLDNRIPMELVKQELARKLAEAAIANDVLKIDVVDDRYNPWGDKVLRATMRVLV